MRYRSLKNLVLQNQEIPTSGDDIRNICDGKVNVVVYSDLANLYNRGKTIHELFKPEFNNCVVLLYQLRGSQGIGHWVSLILDPTKNTIRFFNPYGLKPDAEINLMTHSQPYLTMLLQKSGTSLDVNNFQFQSFKNDISTCGLHCGVRCTFYYLTNREYQKFLESYDNNKSQDFDKLVTLMCLLVLDYGITREPLA